VRRVDKDNGRGREDDRLVTVRPRLRIELDGTRHPQSDFEMTQGPKKRQAKPKKKKKCAGKSRRADYGKSALRDGRLDFAGR